MSEKVLIIEDEENITKLLKVYLIHAGFTVDNAFDGEKGLEKIDSFKPNIFVWTQKFVHKNSLFGWIRKIL